VSESAGRPGAAAARRLAAAALAAGEPTSWFEPLYAAAGRGEVSVPWAARAPNPHLLDWLDGSPVAVSGRKVLVVGCGLGDDAEAVAARGAKVTAFDIAPSAIAAARRRFRASPVSYVVADLLQPPLAWRNGFDLVIESGTLQVLPGAARARSVGALAELAGPGGRVLVISRLRDDRDLPGSMPWPLTAGELRPFIDAGLVLAEWEDFDDDTGPGPPVRRLRAVFTRPGAGQTLSRGTPAAVSP
jgi:SAM-dependent methyltransferase